MVKLKENMFNGSTPSTISYLLLRLRPDRRNVISLKYVHDVEQNINNLLETPQNFCAPFRT